MNLVPGIAGGTHVGGAPLTTDIAMQASPELLRNAIDKAVVKIRPMATPLDQISRLGHVRDEGRGRLRGFRVVRLHEG